jgi:uncharacterized membrane protein YphA (DoxX/SURF4 family)
MLNTFPSLLTYGFFAPMVLRILVAASFFYIAYAQTTRRKEISQTGFPFIGKPDPTLVIISAICIFLTGVALFLGWHTQIAALVGIVICLKHAAFAKKYPRAIPLCRLEYIYMLVILLTLLISGAGALAMDVPL